MRNRKTLAWTNGMSREIDCESNRKVGRVKNICQWIGGWESFAHPRIDRATILTEQEFDHLKSQIVISSWGILRRAYSYTFTEQSVAMLSGVLRSKRAI